MFDSKEEILEKIRLGEDSLIEFKSVRFVGSKIKGPQRDDLADELAAFANRREGVLLLGVDNKTRQVEGIPVDKLDLVEDLIREVCNDAIKPPLVAAIVRMMLPDTSGVERAVIKVDVPRSLFVHLSPGGYLHRVGSSKRIMPPDYLARLFQQRSQTRFIRFDEQAVPNATLDDLSTDMWMRFHTARTLDSRNEFLGKQGMACQEQADKWRPTVAGVLMAAPDPRRWLPNAFIQAVAYAAASPAPETPGASYQTDAKDIAGSLDMQIIEACRFIARNARVGARKSMGRIDEPQFDMTAVFEAVVNAVAHRDYSIYGSKIRLQLFSDRLVIRSPGSLPNTMTVESMAYRQASRNEVITSLLARCRIPDVEWLATERSTMMDKRGEGVPIILESSKKLSGKEPIYRYIDDAELELTIFAANKSLK
ncbi:MAG: putative DNA binding domain-containing protein [Elusimicrobia bacterium]|nr:putative DNA binding domain-containing protein [Elusimicrobiota bacterium]